MINNFLEIKTDIQLFLDVSFQNNLDRSFWRM